MKQLSKLVLFTVSLAIIQTTVHAANTGNSYIAAYGLFTYDTQSSSGLFGSSELKFRHLGGGARYVTHFRQHIFGIGGNYLIKSKKSALLLLSNEREIIQVYSIIGTDFRVGSGLKAHIAGGPSFNLIKQSSLGQGDNENQPGLGAVGGFILTLDATINMLLEGHFDYVWMDSTDIIMYGAHVGIVFSF